MDIRRATTVDQLIAAEHLYDGPARPEWAERFLAADGHLMLIAYVDGAPAGMVSGIEMLHPDKGTEMCLYELSVDEPFRGRGIGRRWWRSRGRAAVTTCGSASTRTMRRRSRRTGRRGRGTTESSPCTHGI